MEVYSRHERSRRPVLGDRPVTACSLADLADLARAGHQPPVLAMN